ncbi:MAG: hypothetical protein RJA69_1217, partial [Pseudomonadota bacterium]
MFQALLLEKNEAFQASVQSVP